MSRNLVTKYMNVINAMEDKKYLYSLLLYLIAPTLDGVKPSTIVTLSSSGKSLDLLWCRYKEEFLSLYKISYIELKKTDKCTTILFYHKKALNNVLYNKYNLEFLQEIGYKDFSSEKSFLFKLKSRFKDTCPHEIGIFLGIPIEEVKSFMEDPKRECIYCGYWKVYNNIQKAKEQFTTYDRSRTNMILEVLGKELSV
ncbi:DUF3793 family protein [Clostridium sporogenes]|uniref:DUF3793 family protein n=1 Tax=Clostridium botulinum TaxID=1491 RepID=A0A6M0T286_CLOBO|nr:DUF3793 family protein [Clostridium sporogenes]NFA61907.1 DUF3793 family protein [Clostridium botulinum]NFI73990.1 DUF3793 family protein [Clostridium sporogenes]NFL73078.1 DUF3793 family protein [Clostridium sporogenes]NFM25429.1 DUF3793 family protein [Clostridium sporogenes]NFP61864.1 DUF3793 family protein [Clostridium sporogenes]